MESKKPGFFKSWSTRDKVLIGGGIALLAMVNIGLLVYDHQDLIQDGASAPVRRVDISPVALDSAAANDTTKSAMTAPLMTSSKAPVVTAEQRLSLMLPPLGQGTADSPALIQPTGPSTLSGSQFTTLTFDKAAVLGDSENRINPVFAVSPTLQDRVSFWFDVYTKYDENKRIIHYAKIPWIVFKVVDVSDIINSKTPRRRWMRNEKADKFAASEARKVKAALASVAKRKNLKNLNSYEKLVVTALKPLGGKVQTRARLALSDTRTQVGQKNFFEEGLRISNRYFPQMEEIFAAQKLPTELTRLPLVESSFNKSATSKVGAVGIWQFMPGTGKKFMLVGSSIDERVSPFKATDAAAHLLKENHLILYRSWPLALTAYNHGPAGVRAAVKATGTKDLGTIARKYRTKNFNFASANFYSCFLAALHAQKYNDKIWANLDIAPGLQTHYVRLPRAIRVRQVLKMTGMSMDAMLLHNPDLSEVAQHNGVLPTGLRFYIPDTLRTKVQHLFAQNEQPEKKAVRRSKG